MNPAAYTPQTVREIRERADKGQSDSSLAHYLGWDMPRLWRVARDHGIEIRKGEWANEVKGLTEAARRPEPMPSPSVKTKEASVPAETPTGPAAAAAKAAPKARRPRDPEGPFRHAYNIHLNEATDTALRAMAQREDISFLSAARRAIAAGLEALEAPATEP